MINAVHLSKKPVLLLGLAGIVFCTTLLAFPIGAPSRLTGGPGEQDCTNCHFGQLGDATPTLRLDGLADQVKAGSRQIFTLTLTHPDMLVAGIQTTVRPVNEEQQEAGRLQSSQLTTLMKDGLTYLNHAQPLPAQSGAVTITVEWSVPMTIGVAILNTAMVAANGDGSPFGDSVVRLERSIEIVSD